MPTRKNIHIALLLNRESVYGRGVMQGVMSYVRPSRTWKVSIGRLSLKDVNKIVSLKWYHVVGTFDGSTIKVYIDGGSPAASTSYSGSIGVSGYPVNIGRGTYDDTRIFDGAINDVGIWDRALTTSEIDYLYNGGTGHAVIDALPGDFEPHGDVDGADLSYLAQRWLFTGCVSPGWCEGADLNHSGEVDLYDFAIFAENYLK